MKVMHMASVTSDTCCFQPIDYARLALSTTLSIRVNPERLHANAPAHRGIVVVEVSAQHNDTGAFAA
jgi:hypothetical protein